MVTLNWNWVVNITGICSHMIDEKNRKEPRFPSNMETIVRAKILKHLVKEKVRTENQLTGIAGGACGGDIIFHELCEEIGIQTEMYLALPIKEYKKKSVSFAGEDWENRFDKLTKKITVHILPVKNINNMPNNIWEEANLWMLQYALQAGEKNMTLIALWDGKNGDKNGGTEHMIHSAKDKNLKINIVNI